MKSTHYVSGGTKIGAEYHLPAVAPNGGVIVLAHGSEGMTNHLTGPWAKMIRDYALKLSRLGFLTLTPLYFQKIDTDPAKIAADFKSGVFDQLVAGRPHWVTALADAVAHAKTLGSVPAKGVGLLGFSLGGNLCLELRSLANVVVAFYAPATLLSKSSAKPTLFAQLHSGEADEVVTIKGDAAVIEQMLRDELVNVDPKRYKRAGHGFIGQDPDNTNARTQSKASTLAYFSAHL